MKTRILLLWGLWIYPAALPAEPPSPPQLDVEALLAEAKSDDASKRLAAYETLRQAGAGPSARLAVLLDPRLRSASANLIRLLAVPAVKAEATKRTAALEAARTAALALIFDERKYPESSHGGQGQPEVDAALEALEAAWEARRAKVLEALPELAPAVAKARELAAALAALGRPQTGGLPRCFESDAILERVCEPERLAAWPVLGGNAFAPSPARTAERALLARVNEYRCRMGLPVLRFDERLYRAAAGFARESCEQKIQGHASETPGKRDPIARAEAEGHRKCAGEAVGYNGTHLEDWLHSASHHRVLADRQATDGAVALWENVAVLMTGQSDPPRKPEPAAGATPAQKLLWEDLARAVASGRNVQGLERLARFLTGQGQKPWATEVWREVVRRAPAHAEARTALGEALEDGRWCGALERSRASVPAWQAKLKAWRQALESAGPAARSKALAEAAEAGARELSAEVRAFLEPGRVREARVLRAAFRAAVQWALPGVEEQALALLKEQDPAVRAAAAEALEGVGGAAAGDALLAALEARPSEYALLQAVEVLTGQRTRMLFTDSQAQREAKIKALKEWWAEARSDF